MSRRTALWLIAAVSVACFAVPYLLIGQVATWYGSFLFWCLAGLAVVVLNIFAMQDFRGGDE